MAAIESTNFSGIALRVVGEERTVALVPRGRLMLERGVAIVVTPKPGSRGAR